MPHIIKPATIDEVNETAKKMKKIAEEVTRETDERMRYFEKIALEYSGKRCIRKTVSK